MIYQALGENYSIVLPVLGTQSIEIPVQQITDDAMNYVVADVKRRVTASAPILIGVGLGAAALYLLLLKKG